MWRVLLVAAAALAAGCLADTAIVATGPEGLWKGSAQGAFMDGAGNMVDETYFLKFVYHDGNVTVSFPGPGSGYLSEDRSVWVTAQTPAGRLCTFRATGAQDEYATGPLHCTRLAGERSDLTGEWWAAWEGPCVADFCD